MCCQLDVLAMGWWRVRRSPTEWGPSLCVIYKSQERAGHGPRCAATLEEISKKCPEYVTYTIRNQCTAVTMCKKAVLHIVAYCSLSKMCAYYTVSWNSCIPVLVNWLSETKEWRTYRLLLVIKPQLRTHVKRLIYIQRGSTAIITEWQLILWSFKPNEATVYVKYMS